MKRMTTSSSSDILRDLHRDFHWEYPNGKYLYYERPALKVEFDWSCIFSAGAITLVLILTFRISCKRQVIYYLEALK